VSIQGNQIQVEVDPNINIEIKQVGSINMIHNPHEFQLNIIQEVLIQDEKNQPNKIVRRTVGRFSLSPAMAKQMLQVLTTNINRFESDYGEIVTVVPKGHK